jgi:hypothetical protein
MSSSARTKSGSCAVHCEDPQYEDRIRALLGPEFKVVTYRRWSDFLSASRTASCSIVEAEDLASRNSRRNLFQFCIYPPLRPLVLITRFDDVNARALKDLCVDEVVWSNRLDREHVSAVRKSHRRQFMVVLGDAIRRNDRLPRRLADALAGACTSPVPIQSQKELLEFSHGHRTTLFRQWHEIAGERQTLKAVLDWVVLLRAALRHDAGQSWREVSQSMGVSTRRLSGIAARLVGRKLSQMDAPSLEERFRRTPLYETLLGK